MKDTLLEHLIKRKSRGHLGLITALHAARDRLGNDDFVLWCDITPNGRRLIEDFREYTQRFLTKAEDESPVITAAVSPDGKHVRNLHRFVVWAAETVSAAKEITTLMVMILCLMQKIRTRTPVILPLPLRTAIPRISTILLG